MFQFFVVFHKEIFDECYATIPQDVLDIYFTFFAVNRDIPKKYDTEKYKNVVKEWELTNYNESMQKSGFNENSALYHIYANGLHTQYDYIGLFQYDMVFKENCVERVKEKIVQGSSFLFSLPLHTFKFCTAQSWNDSKALQHIVQQYETYYKRGFDKTTQYPLLNCYILPSPIFDKTMKWVTTLYPSVTSIALRHRRYYHGYIGTVFERIMAFAIGQEGLTPVVIPLLHEHK